MKHASFVPTLVVALAALAACGGSASGDTVGSLPQAGPTELRIAGSPATDGVFDAAPTLDGSNTLWMSHSIVRASPNDPIVPQVRTRIASSTDRGATWTDAGVDPNRMAGPDLQVPDGKGGATWATWRFEVSRLLYDPYDVNPARRWKLLWHRLLAANLGGQAVPIATHGWIGYATAATPGGTWSAERKLFTGAGYDAVVMDAYLGAPEFALAARFPGAAQLGGCAAFTEPGLLARADGIYVSLQCAASAAGKIVLLRCDRAFASCAYLGDLLTNGEAAQFSWAGEALAGFAAPELVESGGAAYLIVTGYEPPADTYRGCLVFRVRDLAAAALERTGGAPALVKRIAGTAGSFNGACGYDAQASASGVIYSEYRTAVPRFRLFASRVVVP